VDEMVNVTWTWGVILTAAPYEVKDAHHAVRVLVANQPEDAAEPLVQGLTILPTFRLTLSTFLWVVRGVVTDKTPRNGSGRELKILQWDRVRPCPRASAALRRPAPPPRRALH